MQGRPRLHLVLRFRRGGPMSGSWSAKVGRAQLGWPCGAALIGVCPAVGDQAGADQRRGDGCDVGHGEDRGKRRTRATEAGQARPCDRDGDGIDRDDAGPHNERQGKQLLLRQL
jgi:hypothetical protein